MTLEMDKIPVAPLREAFEQSGMTLTDVACAAGWTKSVNCKTPDTTRVARYLGLRPWPGGGPARRSVRWATRLEPATAAVLVRAMGLDPVDFREFGL